MKFIFFVSLGIILYTYMGYLLILLLINRFKPERKVLKDENYTPSVSLIISAHNEEKVIRRKLEESLNLDYPKDKLEIIVASDASSDNTDRIVKGFSSKGVILVRQNQRRGKTSVQNLAVKKAKGEILVFSDATTIFRKDAIRKLVRNFKDPHVGCVAGEERFLKKDKGIFEEVSFFWRYEQILRENESRFNSLIGVSGCIFAIRKNLYEELDESLIEDFALPLKVILHKFRVVYEKEAVGYEESAKDLKAEILRKARIICGGINVLFKMRNLLNPFKYPLVAFQLFSHKILRWSSSVFMCMLFFSNMFLLKTSKLFLLLGILQIVFYSLIVVSCFLEKRFNLPKIFRIISHFFLVNMASIIGIFKFLKGERNTLWEPIR